MIPIKIKKASKGICRQKPRGGNKRIGRCGRPRLEEGKNAPKATQYVKMLMRLFRKQYLKDKTHWKHLCTFSDSQMKEYFTKDRFRFPEAMFDENAKVFR